ncbi:MAG: hypothetical protein WAU78_12820 [Roseiarcus sp.]
MTEIAVVSAFAIAAAALSAIAPLRSRYEDRAARKLLAMIKAACACTAVFALAYGQVFLADLVGQVFRIAAAFGALGSVGVLAFLSWERDPRPGDDLARGFPIASLASRMAWAAGAALVLAISVAVVAQPGTVAKAIAPHEIEGYDE